VTRTGRLSEAQARAIASLGSRFLIPYSTALLDVSASFGQAGAQVFFPDPWHEARHNKRQRLQGPFVALLASRMAPRGRYIAPQAGKTMRRKCASHCVPSLRLSTRYQTLWRGQRTGK